MMRGRVRVGARALTNERLTRAMEALVTYVVPGSLARSEALAFL